MTAVDCRFCLKKLENGEKSIFITPEIKKMFEFFTGHILIEQGFSSIICDICLWSVQLSSSLKTKYIANQNKLHASKKEKRIVIKTELNEVEEIQQPKVTKVDRKGSVNNKIQIAKIESLPPVPLRRSSRKRTFVEFWNPAHWYRKRRRVEKAEPAEGASRMMESVEKPQLPKTVIYPLRFPPIKIEKRAPLATRLTKMHGNNELAKMDVPNEKSNKKDSKNDEDDRDIIKLSCPECKKTFMSQVCLDSHVNYIHNRIGFPCEFCPKIDSQKRQLINHVKRKHSNLPQEEFDAAIDKINNMKKVFCGNSFTDHAQNETM